MAMVVYLHMDDAAVVGHIMAPSTSDFYFIDTLWLCQNSHWKWPFIVSFPIKNGDFQ